MRIDASVSPKRPDDRDGSRVSIESVNDIASLTCHSSFLTIVIPFYRSPSGLI
jgi:hypothetical protein